MEVIDRFHPSVRGEELENTDYVEEADDLEKDIPPHGGVAAGAQGEEEEEDDPMETEIAIPLDMEDEAFFYCAGYDYENRVCRNITNYFAGG